jgi:hypothetical protein
MYPRWFDFAVVLLWLTTMGWLVTTKVVPSFLVGEAPSYPTILAAQRAEPAVGWTILWNERRLGWAVSSTKPMPQGLTEVRSLVHFDDLPLDQLVPDWLRTMVPPIGRQRLQVPVESRSWLVFDPLGRLSRFESSVRLEGQEPFVKLRVTVDGPKMELWLRVGDVTPFENHDLPAPRDAILGDTLSPQSRLPGLREGQTWTVQSYSPLRPPNSPNELLYASVESRVPLMWNGRMISTFLVVYRSDPAEAVGGAGEARGKLWVRPDGTVLRQQVMMFRAALTFLRLSEQEAALLAAKIGEAW